MHLIHLISMAIGAYMKIDWKQNEALQLHGYG